MKLEISVVILGHPIISHPSPKLILEVIKSLDLLTGVELRNCIIAHDGLKLFAGFDTRRRYREYLGQLSQELQGKELDTRSYKIIRRSTKGHLIGNLRNALKHVDTEFVLIVQQDLKFIKKIDLGSYLKLMMEEGKIKHLRFNKSVNIARGWDCGTEDRRLFFGETGTLPPTIQTLSWSDENHLTRKIYYEKVIFPIVTYLRTFPESIMNMLSNRNTHSVFGTYIAGGGGESPAIKHLDGSLSDVVKTGSKAYLNKLKRRVTWSVYFRFGKITLYINKQINPVFKQD